MKDLVILGAGPAGLTAGLYAARARMDALLLERMAPGGQILNTEMVENYPGFPEGIGGFELVDRMKRQAERFGIVIEAREALKLELSAERKVVHTDKGLVEAKALILACGATPRKLEIEGEELLTGKGVSYCATCDGAFYRDQEVAVIGGGDTAVEEAEFLTRFADKVYVIHRRDKLRAAKAIQEKAMKNPKIEFVWNTVPKRITGTTGVDGLDLEDIKTSKKWHLPIQGVFVLIGYIPNSHLVKDILELDPQGFVVTNNDMETSVPGVFAAGDIRSKLLRQISTAVGDGATAAVAAERFVEASKK